MSATAGIYFIMNLNTGTRYIGSSRDMSRRIVDHRSALNNNRHACKKLQCDWNDCGETSFVYGFCEKMIGAQRESLVEREKYWISHYPNVYNDNIGGWEKSAQHREKISQALLKNPTRYWLGKKRPDICEKISESLKGRMAGDKHPMWGKEGYWKGKKRSKEFIDKVSVALKGQKRTAEARQKMSMAKIGKEPPNKFHPSKEMLQDIADGITYGEFERKYNKCISLLKRIKKDFNVGIKPQNVRIEPTQEMLEDIKNGITQKQWKAKYNYSEGVLKRIKKELKEKAE